MDKITLLIKASSKDQISIFDLIEQIKKGKVNSIDPIIQKSITMLTVKYPPFHVMISIPMFRIRREVYGKMDFMVVEPELVMNYLDLLHDTFARYSHKVLKSIVCAIELSTTVVTPLNLEQVIPLFKTASERDERIIIGLSESGHTYYYVPNGKASKKNYTAKSFVVYDKNRQSNFALSSSILINHIRIEDRYHSNLKQDFKRPVTFNTLFDPDFHLQATYKFILSYIDHTLGLLSSDDVVVDFNHIITLDRSLSDSIPSFYFDWIYQCLSQQYSLEIDRILNLFEDNHVTTIRLFIEGFRLKRTIVPRIPVKSVDKFTNPLGHYQAYKLTLLSK